MVFIRGGSGVTSSRAQRTTWVWGLKAGILHAMRAPRLLYELSILSCKILKFICLTLPVGAPSEKHSLRVSKLISFCYFLSFIVCHLNLGLSPILYVSSLWALCLDSFSCIWLSICSSKCIHLLKQFCSPILLLLLCQILKDYVYKDLFLDYPVP